MVAHLSSKLSHLAQSFRPQTLRGAFPSSATTNPNLSSANQFFTASNPAASGSAPGSSLNSPGPFTSNGAPSAGREGKGTAGGGERKRTAGAGQRNWAFQPHARLTAQAPASSDPSSLLDDDSAHSTSHSPRSAERTRYLISRDSRQRLALRPRRSSLASSGAPSAAAAADLLPAADAPPAAARRLSTVEMQRRYHSAFSRGQRTQELVEMEASVEELDAKLGKSESAVVATGRRASISTSNSPIPSPAQTPRSRSPVRQLHTQASAFPACEPPRADVPRVRRNSTSAVEGPTISTETTSPPLADGDSLKVTKRVMPPIERRPRTSQPAESSPAGSPAAGEPLSESQRWFVEIQAARTSRNYRKVLSIVDSYRRNSAVWTTSGHNAALEALAATRLPGTPITALVELYNELFSVEGLRPTRRSYETVINVFCIRDEEVLNAIRLIENRVKKRELLALARGPWHDDSVGRDRLNDDEVEALAKLRKEDYLSPAVEIYKALGTQADQLDSFAVNALIHGAAHRGRIDLALSLFSRLESSLFQGPTAGTYVGLLDMYGEQAKEAEAVKQVFEGYLAARAAGMPPPASSSKRVYGKKVPTKNRYSTEAEFELQATLPRTKGDEWVWRTAIKALFDADDAVGAVALVERMLDAQVKGNPPKGYPPGLQPATVAAVVRGFCQAGDFDSARTWFDRLDQSTSAGKMEPAFYSSALYAALAKLDSSPAHADFLNHVYRRHLAQAGADHKPFISDFMNVIDYNIAMSFTAHSPEHRHALLDVIAEFRPKFEAIVRAGWVEGVDVHFNLSSGMFQRLTAGYGLAGRYDEAAEAFASLGNIIRGIIARGVEEGSYRTHKTWVMKASQAAAGALGMVPGPPPRIDFEMAVPAEGIPRPSLKQAATIIGWLNSLRSATDQRPVARYEDQIVVGYLEAKQAANGDVPSLLLNGHEWFTVIEAFANVAASVSGGFTPAFAFPGFESVIDDYLEAGQPISAERGYDFGGLLFALAKASMPSQRRMAVLTAINPKLAQQYRDKQTVNHHHQKRQEKEDSDKAAAAAAAERKLAAQSSPPPLADLVGEQLKSRSGSPRSFPTPPSTPPPYFAELEPAPVPAQETTTPAAVEGSIVNGLTNKLESLVHANQLPAATQLVVEQAAVQRFAHPDSLAKLIEALGRAGSLDRVRQVYLIAYDALQRLAAGGGGQSLAWINLEDKMIIALAQLGELQDVAVHRDRLYAAGSAPSADAYAAMILNMKETTDDAAVAVTIFEESQRANVAPNVYLFNTLISKLSRARRAKDALVYFELMKQCNLQPSSITYGAIIAACCKAGDGPAAEYLFAEMSKSQGFRPRVPPYNTMMQYFTHTKPDRDRALAYFDAMLAAAVKPTGHTYKLLLDAYGAVGEPDTASMEDVFNRLANDPNVAVTGAHWASLIHAYGGVKGDLPSALNIFEGIRQHPSTARSAQQMPDAVVYEALLNACVANGRADLCQAYLQRMQAEGVRMTAYVANTLIKAHAAQGDLVSARGVFESLADPPSGVAAAGNHERAGGRQTDPAGVVYREPSTWDIIIRAYVAQGDVQEASALLARMEQRAFPEAVYNKVRKVLADVGAERLEV